MKLIHGSKAPLALHLGLCLTDRRAAAVEYSRGACGEIGFLTGVELITFGLRVVEMEGFGEGESGDAPGDTAEDLAAMAEDGIDVVTFEDEVAGMDERHQTWRIVSEKALAACRVLGSVK